MELAMDGRTGFVPRIQPNIPVQRSQLLVVPGIVVVQVEMNFRNRADRVIGIVGVEEKKEPSRDVLPVRNGDDALRGASVERGLARLALLAARDRSEVDPAHLGLGLYPEETFLPR